MTNLDHWASVARTFHTLESAPGVAEGTPASPYGLDEWACGIESGDGVREAAQFVLHLWSGSPREWKCGDFRLRAAMQAWDDDQKEAFTLWVIRGARFF